MPGPSNPTGVRSLFSASSPLPTIASRNTQGYPSFPALGMSGGLSQLYETYNRAKLLFVSPL
jgi:hypothetical protein